MYRLALLCCVLLTLTALAQAAEAPKTWLLNERIYVPAHMIAEKLGATCAFEKQTVTLTKDETTLVANVNYDDITVNGTIVASDAPCFLLHGVPYLPLRTVAKAFSVSLTYRTKEKTVLITPRNEQPFTLSVAPFPRPACLADDTLAGLTPGDHLAVALTRHWFALDENPSDLPGYQRYVTLLGERQLLLCINLDVKDEIIGRITVTMGRFSEYAQLPPHEDVGTASGIQLWHKLPPADLRRTVTLARSPRDKSVTLGIPRGRVQLAVYRTTIRTPHPITYAIVLAPRTAPKSWFPAHLIEVD
ncbi:MAG: copper amine oxidase N-terminal domain-containing protein [Armatimonadota bacterium]